MADLRSSLLGYHSANAYQMAPLPPFVQPGDLLVAVIGDRYLPSFPSGWKTVDTLSGTNQSGKIGWKVLTNADIGAGSFTYTLAAPGTGSFALVAFVAGTFRPAADQPVSLYVQSINPDINEELLPYLPVERGQTVYHFANGRTAGPGLLTGNSGRRIGQRDNDPDAVSALYAETVTDATSEHITWSSSVPSNGAYKASFIVNDPRGTMTMAGIDGTANVVTAAYSALPVRPFFEEVILTLRPTLVASAYGNVEPFQVQFEAYSDPMAAPLWTETVTGAVTGEVSATMDADLVVNQVNLWRVRAGDGTTWSDWSAMHLLYPMLKQAYAQEYLHANVGPLHVPADDALDYQHLNGGGAQTDSDDALEYQHVNQGFLIPPADVGAEGMHQNVNTLRPAPHLWFAYLDYGFDGDYITLVGQGLGDSAAQYQALVRFRYGTDFTWRAPTVESWAHVAGSIEGLDERRRIYRGADGADYVVNQEHDVVIIRFPAGTIPPKNSATNVRIRIQHLSGYSNEVLYTLYPMFDTPLSIDRGNTRSVGSFRLTMDSEADTEIEQSRVHFLPSKVTALGGMLEREPQALVSSNSTFRLAGQSTTANLEIPANVPLGTLTRWRAVETSVEPRPDLGTGVSLWTPSAGPATNAWRIVNGSEPYVDDVYRVLSRNGEISRPAMVFPSDTYSALEELSPTVPSGLSMTIMMAAVLYPQQGGTDTEWSTIFELTPDAGVPAGSEPLRLVLAGDLLQVKLADSKTYYMAHRIPGDYLGRRPVIISLTLSPLVVGTTTSTVARHTLVANQRITRGLALAQVASASRLHLGRDKAAAYGTQRMDVLDLAVGPALSTAKEGEAIVALDSAYGVTS